MAIATPITVARVAGGSSNANPTMRRLPEDDSETGLRGSPVIINGAVYEQSGAITVATGKFAGISAEDFHNLTSDATPKVLSAGTPVNQPSATVIPMGAPLSDGKIGTYIASPENVFTGVLGTTGVAATPAETDVGVQYGLTKDTNNYWYVDKAKTTTSGAASASQAIVTVVQIDPQKPTTNVLFRFNAVNQLFAQ